MKFLLTLIILIGWTNTMRLNTHIHTEADTNIDLELQGLEKGGNIELFMTGVIKAFTGHADKNNI